MPFLPLTKPDGSPTYVNMNHVVGITPITEGERATPAGSVLHTMHNGTMTVTESPIRILRMLEDQNEVVEA
jgi:hypothetical protein